MAAISSSIEELQFDRLEIHETQLDSPPFWDIYDDNDDCGPRPCELYGTFTWTIDNFSQIDDKEICSDSFEAGGHKWCLLIYPQGLVNNHLSLFLCVVNHDALTPGWNHFAQFTISIVNKDTTKSKYSDTLHRFWNKEHDWGWKKFIELSQLPDGFLVDDILTMRAQVQVIRERVDRPFHCLDEPYRKELSKVYLANVEQIVRRFIDNKRREISKSSNDERKWSRLTSFWLRTDPITRQHLTSEKTDTILRPLVKYFFVEKEVTSTLMMDSLYTGLKVMTHMCKNREEMADIQWPGEDDSPSTPVVIIDKDNDMFVLADDAIQLLEQVALLDSGPNKPAGDDKSSENCSNEVETHVRVRVGTLVQKRSVLFNVNGSKGDKELSICSAACYDTRLAKLGWKALEIFFLDYVFRLTAFWLRTDTITRQHLISEKTDTILRPLVKHFFVVKEVTSTLMMDSLHTWLKVMKQMWKNREEMADFQWPGEDDSPSTPVVIMDKDNDMFVLADDAILLIERVALLNGGARITNMGR